MSRTNFKRWIAGIVALLVFAACNYGHQEDDGGYRPLVFPGEARLGATVAMVIAKSPQDYDDDNSFDNFSLTRDRVRIYVDDGTAAEYSVIPRSVFSLELGRSVLRAKHHAHAWFTVALFDIPPQLDFLTFPQHAYLNLFVALDDSDPTLFTEIPSMQGIVWIVGTGGAPTSLSSSLFPNLESEFEPTTAIRLSAREPGAQSAGFDVNWTIGGIQLTFVYDKDCVLNPRVYTQGDAMGAASMLSLGTAENGKTSATLMVSSPRGFSLFQPDEPSLRGVGQGPIIDIAFERGQEPSCVIPLDDPLSSYATDRIAIDLQDLVVKGVNGHTLLGPVVDALEAFDIHYVDPL